jgi:hypothetical protein
MQQRTPINIGIVEARMEQTFSDYNLMIEELNFDW